MATTPKFCSNCGTPLPAGARFCARCGTPAQAAAAPASPTPPPPAQVSVQVPTPAQAEPIVGVITLQRRAGFMGMSAETFNMIVTPFRLAFVAVSNDTMKEAVTAARDQARAQGKGFFAQMGAQMAWLEVLYARYKTAPVDVTLAQNPGSFVLLNQEVRAIRLKDPALIRLGPSTGQQNTRSEITIETAGDKHKFELVTMKAREARDILERTLGGVIR